MANHAAVVKVVFKERLHDSRPNDMDTTDTAAQKNNDAAVIDGFTSARDTGRRPLFWVYQDAQKSVSKANRENGCLTPISPAGN